MFALPNTCIFVIKYAYPHYQIRIFVPHFVCIFLYADTINRPLQLLTAANYVANTLQNTQRTPTKWGANTPLGVGADSSRPYPDIAKYAYSHYQKCISTLPNTHICPPFRVYFPICGRDKSAPTAADGLPITWRTLCKTLNVHPRNGVRTFRQA